MHGSPARERYLDEDCSFCGHRLMVLIHNGEYDDGGRFHPPKYVCANCGRIKYGV